MPTSVTKTPSEHPKVRKRKQSGKLFSEAKNRLVPCKPELQNLIEMVNSYPPDYDLLKDWPEHGDSPISDFFIGVKDWLQSIKRAVPVDKYQTFWKFILMDPDTLNDEKTIGSLLFKPMGPMLERKLKTMTILSYIGKDEFSLDEGGISILATIKNHREEIAFDCFFQLCTFLQSARNFLQTVINFYDETVLEARGTDEHQISWMISHLFNLNFAQYLLSHPSEPARTLIALNDKGEIIVKPDPVYEAIRGVEIRRIRQCSVCKKMYWAGRIDQPACSKRCGQVLRVRRWRVHYTEKYKERRCSR